MKITRRQLSQIINESLSLNEVAPVAAPLAAPVAAPAAETEPATEEAKGEEE